MRQLSSLYLICLCLYNIVIPQTTLWCRVLYLSAVVCKRQLITKCWNSSRFSDGRAKYCAYAYFVNKLVQFVNGPYWFSKVSISDFRHIFEDNCLKLIIRVEYTPPPMAKHFKYMSTFSQSTHIKIPLSKIYQQKCFKFISDVQNRLPTKARLLY